MDCQTKPYGLTIRVVDRLDIPTSHIFKRVDDENITINLFGGYNNGYYEKITVEGSYSYCIEKEQEILQQLKFKLIEFQSLFNYPEVYTCYKWNCKSQKFEIIPPSDEIIEA